MLTESLRHETRYDYHWCSAVKVLSRLASGVGVFLLLLLAFLTFKSVVVPNMSPLLLTSLLLVSLGFYTSEVYYERKRKQERLITKLSNHAVAVGPALMLMHQEQDGEVLNAVTQLLKTHLPMLREKDCITFNARQRASLCFLIRNADQELALAAIGALRYVGDERAIWPLQALLASKRVPYMVCDAVEESLHAISLRAAASRQARTLLRAGSSAAAVPSSLLRSSGKDLETGPDQLVRAVK